MIEVTKIFYSCSDLPTMLLKIIFIRLFQKRAADSGKTLDYDRVNLLAKTLIEW